MKVNVNVIPQLTTVELDDGTDLTKLFPIESIDISVDASNSSVSMKVSEDIILNIPDERLTVWFFGKPLNKDKVVMVRDFVKSLS